MATLPSRFTPWRSPRLNWAEDPMTRFAARALLRPPAAAPKPPLLTGWQPPSSRAGLASIVSRYQGTTPAALPDPAPGVSGEFRTVSANPAIQPTVSNPNLAMGSESVFSGSASPATKPALTGSAGPTGDEGPTAPMLSSSSAEKPIAPPYDQIPEVEWPARGEGRITTDWRPERDDPTHPANAFRGAANTTAGPSSSLDISSTDRYYARQAARGVSRRSSDYPAARRFLRIDGSAPQSSRDTLRPAPVDFTGNRMIDGSRARGFGASPMGRGSGAEPSETAAEIKEGFQRDGGAQWARPMGYGDLLKKYSWQNEG